VRRSASEITRGAGHRTGGCSIIQIAYRLALERTKTALQNGAAHLKQHPQDALADSP